MTAYYVSKGPGVFSFSQNFRKTSKNKEKCGTGDYHQGASSLQKLIPFFTQNIERNFLKSAFYNYVHTITKKVIDQLTYFGA